MPFKIHCKNCKQYNSMQIVFQLKFSAKEKKQSSVKIAMQRTIAMQYKCKKKR